MSDGIFFGVLLAYSALLLIVVIGWYILQAVAYWKIFTKAGEAGWKSLIPFYSTYVQFKLTWNPMWFFVLVACAAANFIFAGTDSIAYVISTLTSMAIGVISIIGSYKLSLAFGHGIGYAIGLIFLNPVFLLILGFGSSEYQGPQ